MLLLFCTESSQWSDDPFRIDVSAIMSEMIFIEVTTFGFRIAFITLTTTPGGKDKAGGSGSKGNGYVWVDPNEYVAMMEPFTTQFRTNGIPLPMQVNCTRPGQYGPDGEDVNSRNFSASVAA